MRKDKITFRVPVVEANLPSNLARPLSLLLCHFARCQIPSKATTQGRYVFSWGGGGKGRGFRGRVINESKHQKGRVIPLCKLFKGRVTHLLQNFLMRIFVMQLSPTLIQFGVYYRQQATFLHVCYAMAHSFLGGLVYFSIRMEIYKTQV